MPSFDEHCRQSIELFGQPFPDVHHWLDELAGRPPRGMRHRQFRHNAEGIEYVGKRWGADAARAARHHVVEDLKMEGWTEDQEFPRDASTTHVSAFRFPARAS